MSGSLGDKTKDLNQLERLAGEALALARQHTTKILWLKASERELEVFWREFSSSWEIKEKNSFNY